MEYQWELGWETRVVKKCGDALLLCPPAVNIPLREALRYRGGGGRAVEIIQPRQLSSCPAAAMMEGRRVGSLSSVCGWAGKKMGKARERERGVWAWGCGGSCRVLNSLGKECGWWRGVALNKNGNWTKDSEHLPCTAVHLVCVGELAASTCPPPSPPVSLLQPAGEVASFPGVERLHVWSVFSTSPLLGWTLYQQVFSPLCQAGQYLTWPNPLFTPLFSCAALGDNGRHAGCHRRAAASQGFWEQLIVLCVPCGVISARSLTL